MPEQNFMMLKSTFELFDRDGGGEIDTDEVWVPATACMWVSNSKLAVCKHAMTFTFWANVPKRVCTSLKTSCARWA